MSNTLVEEYNREGYVIVRNVLDADLIAEGRAHIDWLQKQNPGLRPEKLDHHLMTQDAFWVRLVSDERLLDIVEQFIGPDIGLFASHYIAKPPFTGKSVPWHQDGSYWPLEPMNVVSFWLALDKCDSENGCMKVIPRTQNKKLISKSEYVKQGEESAFDVAMDASLVDESEAVDIALNPGDIEIHHPNIFHGSHVNKSSRWRRGLTIRYIPTSTRITRAAPHPAAFIFRGQGHANGNGWNPLPMQTPATSMQFADQEKWNAKCAAQNEKYADFFHQS